MWLILIATFTVFHVKRRDAGAYSLPVTNAVGNVVSSNALLQVRVPQRLDLPQWLTDGNIRITSRDADGEPLLPEDLAGLPIEASTNLIHWHRLTNSPAWLNGSLLLQDWDRANHPVRFYRILEP